MLTHPFPQALFLAKTKAGCVRSIFFPFATKGKWKALDAHLLSGWGISKPKEIPGRNPADGLWVP